MKKIAYIVGSNSKESLSPEIFNYWFKQNNINAEYLYKEINPLNFDNEIEEVLKQKNVCGFNVTIPYKELIIDKINNTDVHSRSIGAVNCVSYLKNKWIGKNTDWVGFLRSINHKNFKTKKDVAIVIGYGGAAKAVVYALKKKGFKKIKIFNRSTEKTKILNKQLGISSYGLESLERHLKNSNLIVNTTPVDVIKSSKSLKNLKNPVVFDIVYNPKETGFLSHFTKNKRLYGISMLLHQAIPCFEEWFGIRPKIDKKLLTHLDKLISQ